MASRSATCWTRKGCTERLGSDGAHLPLEQRPELLLPEDEETLLVRADLMQADVIEPGIDAFLDRAEVWLGIRADGRVLRRLLDGDGLDGRLEVRGPADLLRELAAQRARGPELVHELARGRGIASPADLHLDVSRFPRAAGAVVRRDDLAIRVCRDEAVGDTARDPRHLRSTCRDVDRRRRFAERVETGVLDGEVRPAVALLASAEEKAKHLDGLFEHLGACRERWPSATHDMLVQVLAGADTEKEAAVEHDGRRRCGLRDDRGMCSDKRAGHARADGELRRRGDPADHRPDERALSLPVDPRVEVVGELYVREPGLLGALRGADDLERAVLLAGDPKADLHDRRWCTGRARPAAAAGRPRESSPSFAQANVRPSHSPTRYARGVKDD